MARAESASASAHSDSIKGLGTGGRKTGLPAASHRRALFASRSPGPHRRVPDHARHRGVRRRARAAAPGGREVGRGARPRRHADGGAHRPRSRRRETGDAVTRAFRAFCAPRMAARAGRPHGAAHRRKLAPSSRRSPRSTAMSGASSTRRSAAIRRRRRSFSRRASPTSTLTDGSRILLALRDINTPLGQLAITQRRAAVLAEWRADTTLAVTLFSATGFVVLMLGFAFLWQSRLMRETATHRGHRAQPHRHRAQPRPLRPVGLGPRAAAASSGRSRCSTSSGSRRTPSCSASARSAGWCIPTTCSSTSSPSSSPTPAPPRSTACSACATRAATGSGCARAASWCARPTSRTRI